MNRKYYYAFFTLYMTLMVGCTPALQIQPQSPPQSRPTPTNSIEIVPSETPRSENTPISPGMGDDWNLVFYDEFDGTQLDESRWVTCYWWDVNGCTILSNNELEWYQPENVIVENGSLILQAKRKEVIGWDQKNFQYTSGMISSGRATSKLSELPRFAFQYGYVEMRARVPQGQGLWPAFWMLPITHESKPEIDIMEILGNNPALIKMHYHYLEMNGEENSIGGEWLGPDFSQDWHTFGVHWEPDQIVWYVDGVARFKFDDAVSVPSEPMYIILNLAVGGDWPGEPDDNTIFPSNYEIDYVRVYQKID